MEIPPKISSLTCPNCGTPFPLAESEAANLEHCPKCARQTKVFMFPALERPFTGGTAAEAVMLEGEATCFYHAQKRAQVPCDACGRFLCALCDLEFNGQHLCPQCLEAGAKKGKLHSLERQRTRWDQIVISLLVLPLVLCWILLPLTSLVTIVLVIWKWNAPPSLVANTRLRLIVGTVLALVELLGGSFAWWMMINNW